MNILPIIYLTYMFISIYFLSFYFLLYLRNRKDLWNIPKLKKHFTVSVLIPAYNEEDSIEATVRSVLDSDYDKILEVIVINDGSTDKTIEIVKKLKKEFFKLKLLDKENSGKADSLNRAIKIAKGELVAVIDSDSFPGKDSMGKLVGFFENDKVGAATCPILVRNRNKFFEKLQAIEYSVIALTRKLLEYIGAIYVTPGPLALYRKSALLEIGGFDPGNLTEDIEVTWHLAAEGWDRKMCLNTRVTTLVPNKFRVWFRQRKRWSMGGLQVIWKYKHLFMRKGIFGAFILPFFILSTTLGLLGLSIFGYLIVTRLLKQYLLIQSAFIANTAAITFEQFYFTPSVLNYLGVVLFIMGTLFTLGILYLMKEDIFKRLAFFRILFYLVLYLAIYPFVLITAIFKLAKRDHSW
jgi:cellulose synthase/poly-beta-1,6-N-acetylglucosamine synthase-like glycosyltransferase